MNTIKKSLAMLLAICMLFGVAACGRRLATMKLKVRSVTEIESPASC